MNEASEREAFEAWFASKPENGGKRPNREHRGDGYFTASTHRMWEAWQARAAVQPSDDGNLLLLWNTLQFFACESSYTVGERTGGVLQGCPRRPPPGPDELAMYGRNGLAALCRYLGREPEEWMLSGAAAPQAPAVQPDLRAMLVKARAGLSNGLWDYGPGQDEHDQCDALIAEIDAALSSTPAQGDASGVALPRADQREPFEPISPEWRDVIKGKTPVGVALPRADQSKGGA